MKPLLNIRNKFLYRLALSVCLLHVVIGIPAAMANDNRTTAGKNFPSQHNLEITLQNIRVKKSYHLRIRAFVNGGDMITLAETTVLPGQEKLLINYTVKNVQYNGIGEVVIDSLGSFPIIINDAEKNLSLNVDNENLRQYTPPAAGPELTILGHFLKIYRGYEAMYRSYLDKLVSPWGRFSSDTAAYTAFLNDYVSFRKQFNLFFQYAKAAYPGTYVTEHLASMFVQPAIQNFEEARDIYFKNWNFNDSTLLNNPLLNRQVDIYRFITQLPFLADPDKATDGLFAFVKGYHWSSELVTDHITKNWTINLFQENKNGSTDKAIEHFYQRWLRNEAEGCSEEAGGEEIFQKAFFKRLANIGKMGTGMLFPDVSGITKGGTRLQLQNELRKKEFTILFVWSTTCSHCEEYTPLLEAFAKKNEDKLQVFAYSIDKKETEINWVNKIERRSGTSNWKDVAEISDMASPGISKIFYTGTPAVFLLDKNGILISKDVNPEVLGALILHPEK